MFGADELAISTADSEAAQGKLTGPTHLAFQAKDEAMVDAVYEAGLAAGGTDNGAPGERPTITPAITPPSCSIPTATISRPSIMARRSAAQPRSRSASRCPGRLELALRPVATAIR